MVLFRFGKFLQLRSKAAYTMGVSPSGEMDNSRIGSRALFWSVERGYLVDDDDDETSGTEKRLSRLPANVRTR